MIREENAPAGIGPIAPVPVAHTTNAWFADLDGDGYFHLPVIALVPSWVYYSELDEGPSCEWEPAVMNSSAQLLPVCDAVAMPMLFGGVLIGTAPASADGISWLRLQMVCSRDHEGMTDRVSSADQERAQRQAGTFVL